ncbi:uncharacterized protein LOC117170106 [Belonocnema kinseyi]|uniref:uncharacterized protein LOC117170106 n=1 Tax=Belonocnema kinseyi TaxID=2817044 RepID=UPI00143DECBB|nr:uncharacterized protein LOC117170106 [Belonocnema kinseyi]
MKFSILFLFLTVASVTADQSKGPLPNITDMLGKFNPLGAIKTFQEVADTIISKFMSGAVSKMITDVMHGLSTMNITESKTPFLSGSTQFCQIIGDNLDNLEKANKNPILEFFITVQRILCSGLIALLTAAQI